MARRGTARGRIAAGCGLAVAAAAVALAAAALGLECDSRRSAAPGAEASGRPAEDARAPAVAEPRGPEPPADAGAPEGGPDRHPLAHLDEAALEARLLEDPASLGTVALGTPGLGGLMNAVGMPEGERWQIVEPHQAWGTPETIESIVRAIDAVHERHGGAPPLHVGDLSRKHGGYIHPHQFHQNGRDVDLGFYYSVQKRWYWPAWRSNLDLPRTFDLVKALVTETDLELVFCDRYVNGLLLEHARAAGEDEAWLRRVFGWREETKSRPLVRHVPGHRTHLHVRFWNPVAQESGRRLHPILKKHRMVPRPELLVEHRLAPGETIGSVAARYKTSQKAIRRVNELAAGDLEPGKAYLVPHRVEVEPDPEPLVVPPRILPAP